jgi:hypothetical protein
MGWDEKGHEGQGALTKRICWLHADMRRQKERSSKRKYIRCTCQLQKELSLDYTTGHPSYRYTTHSIFKKLNQAYTCMYSGLRKSAMSLGLGYGFSAWWW